MQALCHGFFFIACFIGFSRVAAARFYCTPLRVSFLFPLLVWRFCVSPFRCLVSFLSFLFSFAAFCVFLFPILLSFCFLSLLPLLVYCLIYKYK